jgi:lysophospholipase L1-like esterase
MRWLPLFILLLAIPALAAQGPYNAHFLAGGAGLSKPLADPGRQWTIEAWVKPDEIPAGMATLAGSLALDGGHPALAGRLKSVAILRPGEWAWLAVSSDGIKESLWLDGKPVASGAAAGKPSGRLLLGGDGFAGKLAGVTISETALTEARAKLWSAVPPNEDLIVFEEASATWPVQLKQMLGQAAPQDAWTLPHGKAGFSKPVAKPYVSQELTEIAPGRWTVGAFKMQVAGSEVWYDATVPGTALTTLVDRGVYPDPDYGLNNLAIPERLAHQSYWYKTEFTAPADSRSLVFNGINYQAEIWLNDVRLGEIKGAFQRGRFDVAKVIRPGQRNTLAVLVSPPPHPGIAHEQSIKAGVGENGGMQAIDGPTFIASEGWDWIPAVRDRNTGIWQDVVLEAGGPARIGDIQVNTILPNGPAEAELAISVPLHSGLDHSATAQLLVKFDDFRLEQLVVMPPGDSVVVLPVKVRDPKLWWPNGMGEAALHALHASLSLGGEVSDQTDLRFGMREISYELSLMDANGHLRRVEIMPGRDPGKMLVDGRHEAIRKIPEGWVQSLAVTDSPAVRDLPADSLSPYLVLKVNGVRVAARGGSWGTDDWRKRVGRDRLEPFFRLHKEAHVNIIRNWVGQNTEEAFYDLADQYGLLVLNDFWASTQDYNIEPQDVPLFLANARDVITRYRHHPSIALWFGRNEGVPQPVLNEGLESLVAGLDGTRLYMGSSNRVNLQDSGPYDYRDPASYFTTHSKGFAVEVGTPSFPTLEAFEAAVAPEDRWPINDVWAYHDWHQSGNGATQKFIEAMTRRLGAPTSLEDFERKAQAMNYESHRAIFEGMNAELWEKTSGRLLWMTQPAWPSTNWQILSSDYDTHAAYYGVQKAAEPIHIQMDLPDHRITAVNNTREDLHGLAASAKVYGFDGTELQSATWTADIAAGGITHLGRLDLPASALVKLRMGPSENFYWQGPLPQLAPQPVELSASRGCQGAELALTVTLHNEGKQAALLNKVTVQHADGKRVLPVYAEQNYVSLLPNETARILIHVPREQSFAPLSVALRGWNAQPIKVVEDWADLGHYAAENLRAHPDLVMMGDSITEGWKGPWADRGICGQTTSQMRARFPSDVIALHPKTVQIMGGTNDIAGNGGPMTADQTFDNIRAMAELAQANGIKVIVASIPPAASFHWRPEARPDPAIREINRRLRDYAKEKGFLYADYWSALADRNGALPPEFGADGVHPNQRGYAVMRGVLENSVAGK